MRQIRSWSVFSFYCIFLAQTIHCSYLSDVPHPTRVSSFPVPQLILGFRHPATNAYKMQPMTFVPVISWSAPMLLSPTFNDASNTFTFNCGMCGIVTPSMRTFTMGPSLPLLSPEIASVYPTYNLSCTSTGLAETTYLVTCQGPVPIPGGAMWTMNHTIGSRTTSLSLENTFGYPNVVVDSVKLTTPTRSTFQYGPIGNVGDVITVYGRHMYAGFLRVTLGNVAVTPTVSLSTQISFLVPPGDGSFCDIRVEALDRSVTFDYKFRYQLPLISSVTYPPGGCPTSGCVVSIHGRHLGYPLANTGNTYSLGLYQVGTVPVCDQAPDPEELATINKLCVTFNATMLSHNSTLITIQVPPG